MNKNEEKVFNENDVHKERHLILIIQGDYWVKQPHLILWNGLINKLFYLVMLIKEGEEMKDTD